MCPNSGSVVRALIRPQYPDQLGKCRDAVFDELTEVLLQQFKVEEDGKGMDDFDRNVMQSELDDMWQDFVDRYAGARKRNPFIYRS